MYRFLFFVGGILIIALGAGLIIKVDVGTGPWEAIAVGLHNYMGFTVGTWYGIVGVVVMLVNAILMKRFPEILALVTSTCTGFFIDMWLFLIKKWTIEPLFLRYGIVVIGICIIAIGIAMYLQPKLPVSPIDQFIVAIHKRFKVSLKIATIIAETIALVAAFIVSGPIGIGTIIFVVVLGFFIDYFYPKFEKLYVQLQKQT